MAQILSGTFALSFATTEHRGNYPTRLIVLIDDKNNAGILFHYDYPFCKNCALVRGEPSRSESTRVSKREYLARKRQATILPGMDTTLVPSQESFSISRRSWSRDVFEDRDN